MTRPSGITRLARLRVERREPVSVRRATLADLPFVDDLRRREQWALGFLPLAVYEHTVRGYGEYARPGVRLWVATVNDDLVGYLYSTPGQPGTSLKVVQVALRRDARRHEYGTALVRQSEAWAAALQRPAVSCRVRDDIEARTFWDALGYEVRGLEVGGRHWTGRHRSASRLERRYHLRPSGLLVPTGGAA